MNRRRLPFAVLLVVGFLIWDAAPGLAQDNRATASDVTSSPFTPPLANDYTFVINDGSGLDTPCTYSAGGPLTIQLPIRRVLGVLAKLKQEGLVPRTVRLEFPAYDVDSASGSSTLPPERDAVSFNGHSLGFMSGLDGTWVMQRFNIEIDWLNLPADPGANGTAVAVMNPVRIDIDTASAGVQNWCTAVDWVAVTIDNPIPPRPWIGVHGIFPNGPIWSAVWEPEVKSHGIPFIAIPNMGNLDSIQSNAGKVGQAIQAAVNRWGVDKVNVVAHSKGGLDTRHYAETSDRVENLVQLGTPNAGSPLADAIESGAIRALGLGNTIAANALAGGVGGYQLTTLYMNRYNKSHVLNSKTSYLAIAGDYTPGTLLNDTWRKALTDLIVGRGDVIVPLASVHSLPGITKDSVASTYPDRRTDHMSMHGDDRFVAKARSRIIRAGVAKDEVPSIPEADAAVSAVTAPPDLQRSQSVAGRVNPGPAQDRTIIVDTATTTSFTLFASSGDLLFTLTSPLGALFEPTSSGVNFEKSEIPGGFVFTYSFDNPPPGSWVAHLQATTAAAVDYSLNAWLTGATVSMTTSATPSAASLNSVIAIRSSVLRAGAPVLGATAQAVVRQPGNSVAMVTLLDNGVSPDAAPNDGIYSGNLSATSQAGTYEIVGTASASVNPFSRESYAQASVSASTSKILSPLTDFGEDTNLNNRYEQLTIRVPVQITSARTYRWSGTLRDSLGNELGASGSGSLLTSTSYVDLRFDGPTLFARGINGPYTLTAFSLAEEANNDILPVADLPSPYTTTAYNFGLFEGPNLATNGTSSALGMDTNGNGLFDRLRVTVGLFVQTAGAYSWSARLRNKYGVEIALTSGSGTLPAGAASIQLDFDGPTIGKAHLDGPYDVTDLLVLGSTLSLSVANAARTLAIPASQFESYDPSIVAVEIDDPSLVEGNSGTSLLAFTLNLNAPSSSNVTINYATSNGTALSGVDYVAGSGAFVIPAGSTSKKVLVAIKSDTDIESDENITISLASATGAVIAKPMGIGTILNDDSAGAAATLTQYRLYHDGTKEHLYTTDQNEYSVLGAQGWAQEGIAYKMLTNGTYNGLPTVPLFRLYHPGIKQHHWTTDSNEATVLSVMPSWFYETTIGYLLPNPAAGTVPLYRMSLANPPLHLWTTDKNEYDTLATRGWVKEGIIGHVVP